MMNFVRLSKLSMISILVLASLIACDKKLFKERAAETPAPSEERIDKSFFVNPSGQKPKTFLCGWAPEMSRGDYEGLANWFVHEAMHCNLEFEVTKDFLVGKMINPSFPENPERWSIFIRIPITKHFYYERKRDEYGRETNEYIENERSDWSARPQMKLNLAGAQLTGLFYGFPVSVNSVTDIEWDHERNFLGFSLNISSGAIQNLANSDKSGVNFGDPTLFQADYRVNFLKFEHDKDFKRIPYHQENSKYLNILHVMGRRIGGVTPDLYVARWDFSQPVKFHLNGVPKRHQDIVLKSIEEWNKTFSELGVTKPGAKAFDPVISDLKHPFDLRYPGITWVSDERISAQSPLGIGMAHADVRNGKILWGSVVMYGGVLEQYINAYAPIATGSTSAMGSKIMPLTQLKPKMFQDFAVPPAFKELDLSMRTDIAKSLKSDYTTFLEAQVQKLAQQSGQKLTTSEQELIQQQIKSLQTQLDSIRSPINENGLSGIASTLINLAKNQEAESQKYFSQASMLEQLGFQSNDPKQTQTWGSLEDQKTLQAILGNKDASQKVQGLSSFLSSSPKAVFAEEGRTLEQMVGAWNNSPAKKTRTFPEMLDSVIMDITTHEIGHIVGLGHQFKENIVPKEGSVPSRYIKALAAKATEEQHFTNYSSVMGYKSGRTEMLVPAEDIRPGPHDKLVLNYMYNGKYATYDRTSDDFKFFPIPEGGKIPLETMAKDKTGKSVPLPTAYFPACNDIDASLGADPFCNRWDTGSRAQDIVKSYFKDVSDNLESNLFALVAAKGNPDYAEYRLWGSALGNFSRVRLFYDELRRRLRSDVRLKNYWAELKGDEDALFEFSQACQQSDINQIQSEVLKKIFAFSDIKDLCIANSIALNEYKFFLNLPEGDHTRIDPNNRYVSGGYLAGDVATNYGHIFGSWYQLTNLPLKFSSLYTLTTATPYLMWWGGLSDNPYYSYPEDKYLYRTLYPREYTRLVADTVKYNMRFASTGRDDTTTMGKSVLGAGWMVPYQKFFSNDSAQLPPSYNETLNQQNEFQVSMVAVLITAVKPDPSSGLKPDHYQKFTATIFDFFTGKETTARDVYILPDGKVIVRVNGMFIYPLTKMKFWSEANAYVIAYKLSYDFEVGDRLLEDSVKFALDELHDQIAASCISHLTAWFDSSNPKFEGFHLPPGMPTEPGKEKLGLFLESIDKSYIAFEDSLASNKSNESVRSLKVRARCDEATRGIGQILSAGALLNGYWLPITQEYLVK